MASLLTPLGHSLLLRLSAQCAHQWLPAVCAPALSQLSHGRVLQHHQCHIFQHQQHQHYQQQPSHRHRRGLATASDAKQLSLHAALRQLYKRVHPDLFSDYPAEQAENERSFKLLQDYLHQARSPTSGPASRTTYHFRFFLMPQQQPSAGAWPESDGDEAAGAGGDGPAAPQFELVQLVLVPPPPPRSASGCGGGNQQQQQGKGSQAPLSQGARQGLRKLLGMCGFKHVLTDDDGEEAADASLKLTTFLPQAAEVVRQHESGPARHETRVANMRAAFRLAHRVVAGFQPGAFTGEQQIELLQRLASALDMLADDPPDLAGLHVRVGHGSTRLDATGVLCLDAGGAADEWAGFLGGVDPDYARDKAAGAAALRGLEGGVAAAAGVRMLFTAAPYLMSHQYRSFLERLAAHAAEHGPVQASSSSSSSDASSSSCSAIPVYVAPSADHPGEQQQQEQGQQQQASAVHEVVGYISVPMSVPAQQVYAIIQANAPAALAVLSSKAAAQQELAQLSASLRARLNLRRVHKDELIGMREFRSACQRLLYHRDLLLRCGVEGLSVRVSDRNRVAPDGSLVDIAWDFDM